MKYLLGVLAGGSLLAGPVHAQDFVELAPSSAWAMNYDDDSCALQREFGVGENQVYLELRQFGPETSLQVVVAAKNYRTRRWNFELTFGPGFDEPLDIEALNLSLNEGYKGKLFSFEASRTGPGSELVRDAFLTSSSIFTAEEKAILTEGFGLGPETQRSRRFWSDEDNVELLNRFRTVFERSAALENYLQSFESGVESLSFHDAFDQDFTLHTGKLRAPMEAMRTCLDELLTHWGIDAEAHKSLTREVIPENRQDVLRIMQRDYPGEMLTEGRPADLRVRMDVSAEGEPTACHLQTGFSDESFERTACQNLMRVARFLPALDAEGEPIASYHQFHVMYRIQ